jgi:CRP/FNR family transcriptional regulator
MEVLEIIKRTFPQLATSPSLLQEVSKIGILQSFKKDTVLLKEESFVKVIPLVISGLIKIYKEEENGNEVLLYYIKPGETCIVSIITAEKNEKSNVKGVVEEDVEVLLVPKEKLYDLRKNFPNWSLFVFNSFNEKFDEVIDMVKVLTFSNKEKRLYDFIIKKATLNNSNTIYKTHQEIANELGSSREVISRLLKKLEKEGKVSLAQKEIKIL